MHDRPRHGRKLLVAVTLVRRLFSQGTSVSSMHFLQMANSGHSCSMAEKVTKNRNSEQSSRINQNDGYIFKWCAT